MPNTSRPTHRGKRPRRAEATNVTVEIGTGNVFTDIGLKNAEELLVKAELTRQINAIIRGRGLTQVRAAQILQIDQPKVSLLSRGRLHEFSIDRLMRFLVLLDQEVAIQVRSTQTEARLKVSTPVMASTAAAYATSESSWVISQWKSGTSAHPYHAPVEAVYAPNVYRQGGSIIQLESKEDFESGLLNSAFMHSVTASTCYRS
jgi:predicted XRE-type DNA-binding protein